MNSKQESASGWLGKSMAEAKSAYLSASLMTILSAGCFVAFSWYLSGFAASWLVDGEVLAYQLLYAVAFITGRYVFAHFASVLNYNAGNVIVAKVKKRLYPELLNNNQTDSISSTLLVTRATDDLKPFYSFFIPYALASVLVGGLLLGVSFWMDKWVGYTHTACHLSCYSHANDSDRRRGRGAS